MCYVKVIMYNTERSIGNRKEAYMYSSDSENIPRKITHLKIICWRGNECTFTNKWYIEQLKNPQFQEQLILMTNTIVIPRIKNTSVVCFSLSQDVIRLFCSV